MPRFFAEVDFTQIPTKNFVVESSATPPEGPDTGRLWNDTSLENNAVIKYWDGDAWVRMDGGGDIPNGMILDRHVAANAAIQWSKVAHPSNLATSDDITASATAVNAAWAAADAAVTTAFQAADATINTRIDNLGTALTGSYVTLDTAQTVTGAKTFTGTTVVPVGAAPTQAVRLSQLTAEATTRADADTALDGRLSTVETAVLDANNATQTELDTLADRVTAAEGVNTTQTTNISTVTSGLATEITNRTTAVSGEATARGAADTALGDRIDAEAATRAAADTANAGAVAAETTRATDAEEALAADIADEATARGDADDALSDDIAAETTRATTAEGTLSTRVGTLEGVDNFTQAEYNTFKTANDAALALKADLVGGKVPLSQLPSVRTDNVYVVDYVAGGFADADEALASVTAADEGDVAVINGGPGGAFINTGAGWVPLSSGASGATDAEVTAAVAAEAALRTTADNALDARLDTLEAVDYETQDEADSEHTARLAAESALGTRIDTEHTHHTADRTAVEAALATEVTNRTTGDATNATAITTEATRATVAEGALDDRIDGEVDDRTAADTSIRDDFAAADAALSTAISDEVTRATGAEGTLTTNLASETSTRGTADTALGVRIDGVVSSVTAEAATRASADSGLNTRVTALEAATTDDDLSALTDRVTATESVNSTQTSAIAALVTADTTIRGEFAAADSAEATTRGTADTALGVRIDDEATARASADTTLGGRIDSEITNRTTADTALGVRIDSAEAAITDAVAAEATARTTAAASEHTARLAAEASLQSDINTRALDADVVHKAGTETVTGAKTFSGAVNVPGGTGTNSAVSYSQLQGYVTTAAYDDTVLAGRVTTVEGAVTTLNGTGAGSVQATADDRIAAAAGVSIAPLVDDKIPVTFLPALALTNVTVYADLTARDAATGQDEGDVAVVTDAGGGVRATYIYDGTTWVALSSPADVTETELAAAVAAGLAALTAGAGLTKTGNTFDVVGTTNRVTVNADSVDIASTYVGQTSITTVGTITTGTWAGTVVALDHGGTGYAASSTADLVDHLGIQAAALGLYAETLTSMVEGTEFSVNHGLGGTDVIPSLRVASTGEVVFADIRVIDADHVGVTVDAGYAGTDLRVTVVGGPVDGSGHSEGRAWSGRAWS